MFSFWAVFFFLQKCKFLATCNFADWDKLLLSKSMCSSGCPFSGLWTTIRVQSVLCWTKALFLRCCPVQQLLPTSIGIYFRLEAGAGEPPHSQSTFSCVGRFLACLRRLLPLKHRDCWTHQVPAGLMEYMALGHWRASLEVLGI